MNDNDYKSRGEEAEATETETIEDLKRELERERENAAAYLANWQRAQADFINFKRRTEQERSDSAKYANAMLILSLLPALDDLERAMGNIPADLAGLAWFDGLRLIYRKLKNSLEAQGLSVIPAEGEEFDPNLHDAVMYEDGEEGRVLQELQRGYKLHDRVIRPAVVKVGRGLSSSEAPAGPHGEEHRHKTKKGQGRQEGS
jgi:molecular chaperone GrpE